MRWPWHKPARGPRPDPGRARKELERVKAQRPEVEAAVAAIRAGVRRNNFAANVFALDPDKRRGQ